MVQSGRGTLKGFVKMGLLAGLLAIAVTALVVIVAVIYWLYRHGVDQL